ncbi:MAG: hypothetical protein NZ700_13925 [Gemmataceae bacterium]|nr:hypothetical protein [Gemmataceae bacterium]MDW8267240.1 hypothetical protein [Gemmataceae bacterium]
MTQTTERPSVANSPVSVVLLPTSATAPVASGVAEWARFCDGLGRDYELLLVGGEGEVPGDCVKTCPRLRLLKGDGRCGLGAVLRAAVAEARHPLLLLAPSPPPADPAVCRALFSAIDPVDLVSGFRAAWSVPVLLRVAGLVYRWSVALAFGVTLEPWPGWLGWRGHGFAWLNRLLFGVRIIDVGSPFKLFRQSIFDRLIIQSDGDFAVAEVLAKANFLGVLMNEVAIPAEPRPPAEPWGQMVRELRQVLVRPMFRTSRAVQVKAN